MPQTGWSTVKLKLGNDMNRCDFEVIRFSIRTMTDDGVLTAELLHFIPECPRTEWHVVSTILLLHRLSECGWQIACDENIFGLTWLCLLPLSGRELLNYYDLLLQNGTFCLYTNTRDTHTHGEKLNILSFSSNEFWIKCLSRRVVVAHHVAPKVAQAQCWHSNANHISLSPLSLRLAFSRTRWTTNVWLWDASVCVCVCRCVGCRCV